MIALNIFGGSMRCGGGGGCRRLWPLHQVVCIFLLQLTEKPFIIHICMIYNEAELDKNDIWWLSLWPLQAYETGASSNIIKKTWFNFYMMSMS